MKENERERIQDCEGLHVLLLGLTYFSIVNPCLREIELGFQGFVLCDLAGNVKRTECLESFAFLFWR
jgi:hypothetical protein